jgi:hypothetical protein
MEYKCDLCGRTRWGHVSELTNKLFFCRNCRDVHSDGIGHAQERKFITACEGAGVIMPANLQNSWWR